MEPRPSPTALEDAAWLAAGKGEWEEAARLFEEAAGACLGHKRAERYQRNAELCRAKGA